MSGQIVNEKFAPHYHPMKVIKIDLVMLINFTVVFKEALCKAEIREVGRLIGATTNKAEARTPILAK